MGGGQCDQLSRSVNFHLTSCPWRGSASLSAAIYCSVLLTTHFTAAPKAPVAGGAGRRIPDKNRASGNQKSLPKPPVPKRGLARAQGRGNDLASGSLRGLKAGLKERR